MWSQIPVYDGRYYINENGLILNSVSGKFLHASVFNNGYYVITLRIAPSISKKFLLHRLLAEAFIPNPHNYPIVLHIDNNKLNCQLSNLKWGTYSENNAQAISDGLNFVPMPDNRKDYILFNPSSPVYITKKGLKAIKEEINLNFTDSAIRNYVFRKTTISQGPYIGWSIKVKDERSEIIP